jgi:hypothetical protein
VQPDCLSLRNTAGYRKSWFPYYMSECPLQTRAYKQNRGYVFSSVIEFRYYTFRNSNTSVSTAASSALLGIWKLFSSLRFIWILIEILVVMLFKLGIPLPNYYINLRTSTNLFYINNGRLLIKNTSTIYFEGLSRRGLAVDMGHAHMSVTLGRSLNHLWAQFQHL